MPGVQLVLESHNWKEGQPVRPPPPVSSAAHDTRPRPDPRMHCTCATTTQHSTGTSALGGVCPAQRPRGCWVREVRQSLASPERQPVGP